MSQKRKHFTPAQKAEIVRRHLGGKEPVLDLADFRVGEKYYTDDYSR